MFGRKKKMCLWLKGDGRAQINDELVRDIRKKTEGYNIWYVYPSTMDFSSIIAINPQQLMEEQAECSTLAMDPKTKKYTFYYREQEAAFIFLACGEEEHIDSRTIEIDVKPVEGVKDSNGNELIIYELQI